MLVRRLPVAIVEQDDARLPQGLKDEGRALACSRAATERKRLGALVVGHPAGVSHGQNLKPVQAGKLLKLIDWNILTVSFRFDGPRSETSFPPATCSSSWSLIRPGF